jgi:hypothetical protein
LALRPNGSSPTCIGYGISHPFHHHASWRTLMLPSLRIVGDSPASPLRHVWIALGLRRQGRARLPLGRHGSRSYTLRRGVANAPGRHRPPPWWQRICPGAAAKICGVRASLGSQPSPQRAKGSVRVDVVVVYPRTFHTDGDRSLCKFLRSGAHRTARPHLLGHPGAASPPSPAMGAARCPNQRPTLALTCGESQRDRPSSAGP